MMKSSYLMSYLGGQDAGAFEVLELGVHVNIDESLVLQLVLKRRQQTVRRSAVASESRKSDVHVRVTTLQKEINTPSV